MFCLFVCFFGLTNYWVNFSRECVSAGKVLLQKALPCYHAERDVIDLISVVLFGLCLTTRKAVGLCLGFKHLERLMMSETQTNLQRKTQALFFLNSLTKQRRATDDGHDEKPAAVIGPITRQIFSFFFFFFFF